MAQWLFRMPVEELGGSAYAAASSVIPMDKKILEGIHSIPKHPTIAAGMNSDRAPGKESNLVKRQIVHYHHMLMQAQKCNSVDVNQ